MALICDSQLYFSRDVKVYIKVDGQSDIWEIPVLDGFSFAQANNSSEVTLAEMENSLGVSRRGKRVFNDNLAPAEWSFTTYARPFVATPGVGGGEAEPTLANVHAVEEVLWALAAGPATRSGQAWSGIDFEGNAADYYTLGLTDSTFDFNTSNTAALGTATIYFVLQSEGLTYEIQASAVNEATVNFDIDGIAQIEWSGMGSNIVESSEPTATIYEAITSTTNFIRNRLTSLTIAPVTASYTAAEQLILETSYDLTLTGGSITLSNNLTYLTPEELGIVNIPLGHVTGTRSFSGSFTNYLVTDTITDKSADFWSDIKALQTVVTHDFALTFAIGGAAGAIRMEYTLPHVHIETPTHSVEDVISLETSFTGLGQCINAADEMTIKYVA